jgi:hypothetical protein
MERLSHRRFPHWKRSDDGESHMGKRLPEVESPSRNCNVVHGTQSTLYSMLPNIDLRFHWRTATSQANGRNRGTIGMGVGSTLNGVCIDSMVTINAGACPRRLSDRYCLVLAFLHRYLAGKEDSGCLWAVTGTSPTTAVVGDRNLLRCKPNLGRHHLIQHFECPLLPGANFRERQNQPIDKAMTD